MVAPAGAHSGGSLLRDGWTGGDARVPIRAGVLSFGVARAFEAYVDDLTDATIRVFCSREHALAWLESGAPAEV